MYKSQRKFDKEQLIFAAQVILAGASDVLQNGLPDNQDFDRVAETKGFPIELTHAENCVMWAAGHALAVLYAQYNPEGDGMGVGDALECAGFSTAWEVKQRIYPDSLSSPVAGGAIRSQSPPDNGPPGSCPADFKVSSSARPVIPCTT